tara:strand:+ start:277 stop:474 length:198 start_codon:yes stop_codon:yes gene_type:complete
MGRRRKWRSRPVFFAPQRPKEVPTAFCYGFSPGGFGLGTLWFLTLRGPGGGGGGGGCLDIFNLLS